MAYSKSVNLANAQTAVPCNVCEDDVPGEYYCKECKQTLCPHCEKNHKRVTATKNHNVVLRTQVGDLDTTILSCTDHGDQASLHCEKCNIAVCMKCVTGKHKGHDMSDLDALQKEKIVLQNDINRMQGALQTLQNKLGELLTEKKKYKKKIETILEDMENENQAAMNELRKIHKERLDNINNIQDSHMAIYEGFEVEMKTRITSYEKRESEYEDTLAKNNLPDLRILTKEQLSLSEIGSKPELPDPPIFVQGNVQTIMENLGKLHISFSPISKPLKLVSKFKCPLKGYPRICITKEGDVWLGGYESRELVMVDINGQALGRRKIQNRPWL
ncbi:hypothetical protein FSP39_010791 [Pinctada imbricata]|uniref:B box-type domain-containing protein n=1 Tax=Pinctada imbricata TaxID=66713 RepID=A0AA89BVQ1_PINIB|nr:hypothetical protein FSP39_010791 [Pinctada imbricata]